jgi:hypothetical protein
MRLDEVCLAAPAASVQGNSFRSAIYSPDGHRGRHVSYRPLRVYQSGRENRYQDAKIEEWARAVARKDWENQRR